MTTDTNPDLATLLFKANQLAEHLFRGDLSAAAPLADVERQLAELAASVGLAEERAS